MNQKGSALGLSSGAHFSNATGLYLADHHLTVKDQAEILNAALANPTARTCLTAKTWTTAADSQHPSGISFKNLFLTRIAEQDTGGVQVLAAKTGYVSQSGNCAASYGVSAGGRHLLVVTAHASGAWNCIYDHALLYKQFAS